MELQGSQIDVGYDFDDPTQVNDWEPDDKRVKQAVENVGGQVIGVVLNNVDVRSDSQYQYYTSYYTYYAPSADAEPVAKSASPNAPAPAPSAPKAGPVVPVDEDDGLY